MGRLWEQPCKPHGRAEPAQQSHSDPRSSSWWPTPIPATGGASMENTHLCLRGPWWCSNLAENFFPTQMTRRANLTSLQEEKNKRAWKAGDFLPSTRQAWDVQGPPKPRPNPGAAHQTAPGCTAHSRCCLQRDPEVGELPFPGGSVRSRPARTRHRWRL